LRAAVVNYHKEAEGQSYCDYGFHLIISDPSPSVLGQELPALVEDGYSSFKVFMTYAGPHNIEQRILDRVIDAQAALASPHPGVEAR
jgi:hypothetical protein